MSYPKYIRVLLICVITSVAFICNSGVLAAQDSSSLIIGNLQGSLNAKNSVFISGNVNNTLPWQVQNVKVQAIVSGGAGAFRVGETTIKSIDSGATATFYISINIVGDETRYGATVTGFSLQSNDTDELLRFFQRDDPPLRQAIVEAFNNVTPDAIPGLLHCIDVTERSSTISDQDLVNDLLCLNGIYVLSIPDAVEPLMGLMALYRLQSADLWLMLSGLLAKSNTSLFYDLQLVNALPKGTFTTVDVFKAIFGRIGKPGLPGLIRSVTDGNFFVRDMANEMLSALGEQQLDDLLHESDQTLLSQIIRAVAETNYQEPVKPLLELAIVNPNQQTVIESSLLKLGGLGVPHLIDALSDRLHAVGDLAEDLLRQQGDDIIPLLMAALPNEQPWASTPANADKLITALRDWSNEKLNTQMEPLFQQGLALFETGDCINAAIKVMDMLKIHDLTPRAFQATEILFCAAQQYSGKENYDEAVILGQQADILFPDNSQMQAQLSDWVTAQARTALDANNIDYAKSFYRTALEHNPDNLSARNGLGIIVLRQNQVYLIVFFLFMFLLFFKAWGSWKGNE